MTNTQRIDGSLYTSIQNNIATIEFGHPASNSFPSVLLERLEKQILEVSEKDDIHVIILKSEGEKAFCAGASFTELIAIEDSIQGKAFFMGFAKVINAMRKSPVPIIGRIHGKTVGGGVGLAAACDYCFATESAAIKLSELTIGIGPFVIEPAVERKIGIAAMSELSLFATKWYSAYWAKEKGLYSQVFDNSSEMDNYLEDFSLKLASYNPLAVKQLKKVLWKNTDHWSSLLEERAIQSGTLVLSEFTKNALAKFK